MAIFNYNEELDQKGSRIAPNKVKGFNKAALAVLGYKDTGERNTWGNIKSVLPNPVGTVASHQMARAFSKGTDTRKVLDETQDENFGMALAQGKTAFQIGKLALGGGIPGVGGASGVAAAGTGTGSQIAQMGSGGATGGLGSNLSSLGASGNTETLSKLGKKPSEYVQSLMNDQENQFIKDDLMKKAEDTDVTDLLGEEETTDEGLSGKGGKFMGALTKGNDLLNQAAPVLQAGLEQYAATKAYNTDLKNEWKQYTKKTTKSNNANII